MSKEEAVKRLIESGYDATIKDGIVYVYGAEHKNISDILKSAGYKQSYGTTTKKRPNENV